MVSLTDTRTTMLACAAALVALGGCTIGLGRRDVVTPADVVGNQAAARVLTIGSRK